MVWNSLWSYLVVAIFKDDKHFSKQPEHCNRVYFIILDRTFKCRQTNRGASEKCFFIQNHIETFHFNPTKYQTIIHLAVTFFSSFFKAFDFCRFCVVIPFFHPRHNGQWPTTSKDFYTRSYPLHYFLILILEKEPVFSLSNVEC